jgi:hypothetical protein
LGGYPHLENHSDFSVLSGELTESSRAETVALLLGEDLGGKQGQGNRCE